VPWTKVQWNFEGHDDRASAGAQPPLLSGSWELRPRYEGMWIISGLVIQPDEWPGGFPKQLLDANNVATAVTTIERMAKGEAQAASK